MTQLAVKRLVPGDHFLWAGRDVELLAVEEGRPLKRRPSRRLHVRVDPTLTRTLSYYDDETVEVLNDP